MRKTRTNYVSTRLADDELAMLKRLLEKKGMLPATLLRVALLDYAARNGESVKPK